MRRLEAAKATSVEAAEGVVERVTAARRTAVLVGTAGGVGGRRRERTWEPEEVVTQRRRRASGVEHGTGGECKGVCWWVRGGLWDTGDPLGMYAHVYALPSVEYMLGPALGA